MSRPKFSIIVPVCHGGELLKETIASLVAATTGCASCQILVAHSDKETSQNVSSSPVISFVRAKGNRASLLNAACREASGKWLVFIDDDCIAPENFVAQMKNHILNSKADLIGFSDQIPDVNDSFDHALDWALSSTIGSGGIRSGGKCFASYYPRLWGMALRASMAKRVAQEGKVFDEKLPVHEDVGLARRVEEIGGSIEHIPQLVIYHHRATTLKSLVLRNFRMARVSRRIRVHRLVHGFISAACILFLALAISAILWPQYSGVLLMPLALYIGILAAGGVAAACHTGRWPVLVMAPLVVSALHISRGAGYLAPSFVKGTGQ